MDFGFFVKNLKESFLLGVPKSQN